MLGQHGKGVADLLEVMILIYWLCRKGDWVLSVLNSEPESSVVDLNRRERSQEFVDLITLPSKNQRTGEGLSIVVSPGDIASNTFPVTLACLKQL